MMVTAKHMARSVKGDVAEFTAMVCYRAVVSILVENSRSDPAVEEGLFGKRRSISANY